MQGNKRNDELKTIIQLIQYFQYESIKLCHRKKSDSVTQSTFLTLFLKKFGSIQLKMMIWKYGLQKLQSEVPVSITLIKLFSYQFLDSLS